MKVAVVGSGVAGLAATWALNEHSEHEVHLFEADDRPGGHANTVRYTRPDDPSKSVDVDTGFIVLNPPTYPNLLRFLRLNSIPAIPTEMTFAVTRDLGLFEWAGKNLFTVFCQPKNLLDPAMWRMVWDVLRFNASAVKLLKDVDKEREDPNLSIGKYLEREGYSDGFRDNYLVPMTAAVWSTPPDLCAMDFPARTLIQFMHNHHLLQLIGKPSWLTIGGGSHLYVNRIISKLPKSQLRLSTPVHAVQSAAGSKVLLTTPDGTEEFDHVILACHSDTALQILEKGGYVTDDERIILSSFGWNKNEAILHCDTKLMPNRRSAWSSWNYLTSSVKTEDGKVKANDNHVALTYCMNILQHIPEATYGPVLVTLNPPFEPRPETVVGRYKYDHPIMDPRAWTAQRSLPTIQNTRHISYAGAWTAYGFHEDGFTSGLVAATSSALGARLPFEIKFPDRKKGSLGPASIFDLYERTGVRWLVGLLLGGILRMVGRLILVNYWA